MGRIRKYNEKTFFEYLKRNSPFGKPSDNYGEFLKSLQNESVHHRYRNDLFARSQHLFYPALIFLIHSNPGDMAGNYKKILEVVKKSHSEYKKEKNEFDTLYDVLTFYTRMVSLDIVEAAVNSKET